MINWGGQARRAKTGPVLRKEVSTIQRIKSRIFVAAEPGQLRQRNCWQAWLPTALTCLASWYADLIENHLQNSDAAIAKFRF